MAAMSEYIELENGTVVDPETGDIIEEEECPPIGGAVPNDAVVGHRPIEYGFARARNREPQPFGVMRRG